MHFFSKLFQYNKWLCLAIAAFCALTVAGNLTKVETTPAFIWGMYSEKEKPAKDYQIFKIIVNDSITIDYTSDYAAATRFYLLSPLIYSWKMQQNSGRDPEENYFREKLGDYFDILYPVRKYLFNDSLQQSKFMKWYAGYLEEATHIKPVKLEVKVLKLNYKNEDQLEIQEESTFAKWRRQ